MQRGRLPQKQQTGSAYVPVDGNDIMDRTLLKPLADAFMETVAPSLMMLPT